VEDDQERRQDLSDAALAVWTTGRTLALVDAAARDDAFAGLVAATRSPDGLERRWGVEALYRNLWHLTPEQQQRAVALLVARIGDSDPHCAEHAIKGVQYASELVGPEAARPLLDALLSLPGDAPETMRMLSIELAYGLFLRLAHHSEVGPRAADLLAHLHLRDPDWVERTVTLGYQRLQPWSRGQREGITLTPIGVVRNGFLELGQLDGHADRAASRVELRPVYAGALDGLERFGHVAVVCYLDGAAGWSGRVAVPPSRATDEVGVFATTAADRPNPVFTKVGRLLELHATTLVIEGLKVLDLTPVLDVKPYLASRAPSGDVREAGWAAVERGR
jgi:tRNA-Thr(GGU) m(6)t(6)A37 methyltransferase TsaA